MTTTIKEPKDLLELVGHNLGASSWLAIPQSNIDLFAEATHDKQWIHVDVERAKTGPFGGPIAHGYLTLSLLIPLWSEILVIENLGMAVNYGLNKVRFPTPVPAGSRVRLDATVATAEEVSDHGIQVSVGAVMHLESASKPACVAEMVHRYYP